MSTALFLPVGYIDKYDVMWSVGDLRDANPILAAHHYLGPIMAGGSALVVIGSVDGDVVAAQVWRGPTARGLPADGSWLELSRWCLTSEAGDNAGSRMHRWAVKLIRERLPKVTTLVSYSDPSHGHDGALYRACNWQWAPTWHRLRTPPTGNGTWGNGVVQAVKDRWVFNVRPDETREQVTHIYDDAAIRYWRQRATPAELRWATHHAQLRGTS